MNDYNKPTSILLITLIVLNICDAVLTWILVQNAMAFEVNPAMAWLIAKGPLTFFVVKIGALTLLNIYVYFRIKGRAEKKHFYIVLILVIVYSLLVLSSLSILTLHWFLSFM